VYGTITYPRQLTEQEVYAYELLPIAPKGWGSVEA